MRVWPLIIFLIVECTIPEFPEQGQSGYEQLPSWLKGWYHLPFQLLRVITPGILWFNLRLYKPPTAHPESAFLSGKIEKSETAQERKGKTDGGEKRLSTFADLTIRSYLEALQASRISHVLRKRIESENRQKRTKGRWFRSSREVNDSSQPGYRLLELTGNN